MPQRKVQLKTLIAANETLTDGESIIIDAPQNHVTSLISRYGLKCSIKSVMVIEDYKSEEPIITKQTKVTF